MFNLYLTIDYNDSKLYTFKNCPDKREEINMQGNQNEAEVY